MLRTAGRQAAVSRPLRIFVNGDLVRERGVPAEHQFTLTSVPLDEGENQIAAALVGGAGGEPVVRRPIVVVRDSTATGDPESLRPDPGATVYGATETLRGRTEPGATMRDLRAEAPPGELRDKSSTTNGLFEAATRPGHGQQHLRAP